MPPFWVLIWRNVEIQEILIKGFALDPVWALRQPPDPCAFRSTIFQPQGKKLDFAPHMWQRNEKRNGESWMDLWTLLCHACVCTYKEARHTHTYQLVMDLFVKFLTIQLNIFYILNSLTNVRCSPGLIRYVHCSHQNGNSSSLLVPKTNALKQYDTRVRVVSFYATQGLG
jgi:hypothetical protein